MLHTWENGKCMQNFSQRRSLWTSSCMRLLFGEGVELINTSPRGCWGMHSIGAPASGSPQRTPWADAVTIALLWLWRLFPTQIDGLYHLLEGWTHESHMVKGPCCIGGWSNTFQHIECSVSWTVQAPWGRVVTQHDDTRHEHASLSVHSSAVHWWWCQGLLNTSISSLLMSKKAVSMTFSTDGWD
jgi:hypothetical protein